MKDNIKNEIHLNKYVTAVLSIGDVIVSKDYCMYVIGTGIESQQTDEGIEQVNTICLASNRTTGRNSYPAKSISGKGWEVTARLTELGLIKARAYSSNLNPFDDYERLEEPLLFDIALCGKVGRVENLMDSMGSTLDERNAMINALTL